MLKLVRTIGRWIVLSTATMWLALNALQILTSTSAAPSLMDWLSHFFPRSHWLHLLFHHAWPWMSLLLVIVLRQETHRWFSVRRGRRSADRLMIGWFVFIGTLLLIDALEPAITLTWPPLAIETSLWLATFCVVTWVSRLLHSATRRRLRLMVKRWHVAYLWSAVMHRIALRGQMDQGGSRHVPKAVTPTKRAR